VNSKICELCGNPLPEDSMLPFHSGPCPPELRKEDIQEPEPFPNLRNEGIPTEPGWYWCYREATQYTHAGVDIVEVRIADDGSLYVYVDGYDCEPNELSKVWQRVKQYDRSLIGLFKDNPINLHGDE